MEKVENWKEITFKEGVEEQKEYIEYFKTLRSLRNG